VLRLIVFSVLFVASLGAVAAGLPRETRTQTGLLSALMMLGCILLGIVAGAGIGWLIGPADGGVFVGAFAFGEVGLMTGICLLVYRVTNHPQWESSESMQKPMALPIAVAIPLCALVAAPLGWALPIEDDTERAMMPMATTLLGALVGALFGIVYEKGVRALLVILAIVALVVATALIMIWLDPP